MSVGSLFGGDDAEDGPPRKRLPKLNGSAGVFDSALNPKKNAENGIENATKDTAKDKDQHDDGEDAEADPLDEFMNTLKSTTGVKERRTGLAEVIMDEDGEEVQAEAEGDDADPDVKPEEYLAMLEQKKKKELAQVDHSKINYEPFRKQFYVEPPELASLPAEEVENMRLELDGIKVRGVNVPKPVVKWAQMGLQAQVMEVVRELGYDKPTAIQAQSIPAIMSGRDVIGVAKTGSGKTMAFLMPLFRQIKDQRPLAPLEGPMALVMTPTRELAVQIYRECRPFTKALGLRAVCAYGGSPIKEQIADLKRGAEIIVCTPGRMIDLLAANGGRVTNLQRVTYLVLDEADRMFDMGFEPQVMRIVNNARPDRQTVLFSATFPRQMEALARKVLHKPVEIIVGARSVVAPEITQIVEVRPETTKFRRVLELLGRLLYADGGAVSNNNTNDANEANDPRALIFVERQESADEMLRELMARGYPCFSIHGGKDQADRDSAINDFKHGVVKVLIATSVAARGLDVKQLKLVINYDPPSHMEDYVHRVGRTGRAGQTGTAVTFITPDQGRAAMDVARALKLSKHAVPDDVQKLADEFMERVKAGTERYGSGFGGKGLERLDEARSTARKRERKEYNVEDDTAADKDGDSDDDMASTAAPTAGSTPAPTSGSGNAAADRLAEAPIVMRGQHDTSSAGKIKAGAAPENRGPDVGLFHTTLEINDLPQEARRAAVQRNSHAKVIESFGVSITQKGTYYPPGRLPGKGDDPKLYLLIEGPTEGQVSGAYRALVSMVLGGIEHAVSDTKGRYSV